MQAKLPGFYVEGRHFGLRISQATARAQHLANEYGRGIEVRVEGISPDPVWVTIYPKRLAAAFRAVALTVE